MMTLSLARTHFGAWRPKRLTAAPSSKPEPSMVMSMARSGGTSCGVTLAIAGPGTYSSVITVADFSPSGFSTSMRAFPEGCAGASNWSWNGSTSVAVVRAPSTRTATPSAKPAPKTVIAMPPLAPARFGLRPVIPGPPRALSTGVSGFSSALSDVASSLMGPHETMATRPRTSPNEPRSVPRAPRVLAHVFENGAA